MARGAREQVQWTCENDERRELGRAATEAYSEHRAKFFAPEPDTFNRPFSGIYRDFARYCGMFKRFNTFWSLAAFHACKGELDSTQSSVLAGVSELAAKMDGWFFHSFTTPSGCLLRCDAYPEPDAWQIYIRTAELAGEPVAMPAAIKSPENEKFAEFWELQKQLPRN